MQFWLKIRRKFGPGQYPAAYILFPDSDIEINAWGMYLLPRVIEKKKLEKIMVITCEEKLFQACSEIEYDGLHVIRVSKDEMDQLIRFYALVDLNGEWMIVSVKEPHDTGAEKLLGKKGITKKDLVWYDVYAMDGDPDTEASINIENSGSYMKNSMEFWNSQKPADTDKG